MTVPNTAADEAAEVGIPAIPGNPIEGRSLGRIAWDRLKRDKVAMVSGAFIVLLVLLAIFADVINHAMGLEPNQFNGNLVDPGSLLPYGARGGMSLAHPFGLEPVNGRDLFVLTRSGEVVRLDQETGEQKWRVRAGKPYTLSPATSAAGPTGSSPGSPTCSWPSRS